LHLACEKGYLDIVRCLIEHGANINATGNDGQTPLQRANLRGRCVVAEYLSPCVVYARAVWHSDDFQMTKSCRNRLMFRLHRLRPFCGISINNRFFLLTKRLVFLFMSYETIVFLQQGKISVSIDNGNIIFLSPLFLENFERRNPSDSDIPSQPSRKWSSNSIKTQAPPIYLRARLHYQKIIFFTYRAPFYSRTGSLRIFHSLPPLPMEASELLSNMNQTKTEGNVCGEK
jgi:hypothetical protein